MQWSRLSLVGLVLAGMVAADARAETYAQRSCRHVRADNPAYTMPIHFACLRWVERGNVLHRYLESRVTHYYCPELNGAKYHRIVDMVDYAAHPADCDNPNAQTR